MTKKIRPTASITKKLYYALFAEVSKITDQLVQIQQDAEERFLDMSEEE